jgi:hypothetical protein
MCWIRSNIGGLSRLALFALALQFALTFGHVHLQGSALTLANAAAVADQATAPSGQAQADNHKSQKPADFDCPICALIQLASTSAPSVAPPLPVPAMVGGLALETPNYIGVAPAPRFAFLARGPPLV